MQWTTIWNTSCPVCDQVIPEGMPPIEVVRNGRALRFRVCGGPCAVTASRAPAQLFDEAQRRSAIELRSSSSQPHHAMHSQPIVHATNWRWFRAWRSQASDDVHSR